MTQHLRAALRERQSHYTGQTFAVESCAVPIQLRRQNLRGAEGGNHRFSLEIALGRDGTGRDGILPTNRATEQAAKPTYM